MKPMKDYYAVLGVSRTATEREISKAFRKNALNYHPDRNKGDKKAEEKFKDISEAYAVLSSPEQRAKYDLFAPQSFQEPFHGWDNTSSRDRTSADDLFDRNEGQGYRRVHTPPSDFIPGWDEILRGLDEILRKQRERYITITPLPQRRGFTRRMMIEAQLQRIFINTADTYTEKRNANIKIRKEEDGKLIETIEQFDL